MLKELRKKKGLSQEKLAQLIGVHWMTIIRWEKGEGSPRTHHFIKIREALGPDADLLLQPKKEAM